VFNIGTGVIVGRNAAIAESSVSKCFCRDELGGFAMEIRHASDPRPRRPLSLGLLVPTGVSASAQSPSGPGQVKDRDNCSNIPKRNHAPSIPVVQRPSIASGRINRHRGTEVRVDCSEVSEWESSANHTSDQESLHYREIRRLFGGDEDLPASQGVCSDPTRTAVTL
jgi:hypothetical protein